MMILVTGGSGSGKSDYAEAMLRKNVPKRPCYYLATMQPFGREGKRRIRRHRKMRKNRNFITVEQYQRIEEAEFPMKSDLLLECMSNLTANEYFSGKEQSEAEVCERIITGINEIKKRARHLVIVTNEVSSDGVSYDSVTCSYIRCLNQINQKLAEMADGVVEVVYSVPLWIKEADVLWKR